MSFFSVVIPTYNRCHLLAKTLESVMRQDYQDFELIVVDDGSTDATKDVVHSFGARIQLFEQKNQGPGAARNLGARKSAGEYLAFLDSDDLWFPWTLSSYAEVIQKENRPAFVAGLLIYFHDEAELSKETRVPLAWEAFPDYYAAGRRGIYCGSGQMAVRRDTFLQAGGFADERFNAEDHDLVMRLGTLPGFVQVRAPAMIAYRQHAEAATRDLDKTFAGSVHLLQMEKAGRYPGGGSRRRDRRRVLAQHIRSLSLELLRRGQRRQACALYRQTFGWNLTLGRVRYLLGFALKAALAPLS